MEMDEMMMSVVAETDEAIGQLRSRLTGSEDGHDYNWETYLKECWRLGPATNIASGFVGMPERLAFLDLLERESSAVLINRWRHEWLDPMLGAIWSRLLLPCLMETDRAARREIVGRFMAETDPDLLYIGGVEVGDGERGPAGLFAHGAFDELELKYLPTVGRMSACTIILGLAQSGWLDEIIDGKKGQDWIRGVLRFAGQRGYENTPEVIGRGVVYALLQWAHSNGGSGRLYGVVVCDGVPEEADSYLMVAGAANSNREKVRELIYGE